MLDHLVLDIAPLEPLSTDQFYELCQANAQLRFERTENHQIIVMAPSGGETEALNLNIATKLNIWNQQQGNRGRVFGNNAGFILPSGAIRVPDVAWMERKVWEALSAEGRKKFVDAVPVFVIEVRSESDSLKVLQDKMEEWIANGVKTAWLIDPVALKHSIYKAGNQPQSLDGANVIFKGEGPFQGFELDFSSLFPL